MSHGGKGGANGFHYVLAVHIFARVLRPEYFVMLLPGNVAMNECKTGIKKTCTLPSVSSQARFVQGFF